MSDPADEDAREIQRRHRERMQQQAQSPASYEAARKVTASVLRELGLNVDDIAKVEEFRASMQFVRDLQKPDVDLWGLIYWVRDHREKAKQLGTEGRKGLVQLVYAALTAIATGAIAAFATWKMGGKVMKRLWSTVNGMRTGRIWIVATVVLVAGTGGFATCWLSLRGPPVVVFDSYEEDATAASGGQLDLIATKIDQTACLTQVARWLWRLDPTDPLPDEDPRKRTEWREVVGTPHTPPMVGKIGTYRLVVPLPEDIEPGDWHYLGQAVSSCAGPLQDGPRFSRDIPIRITRSLTK